MHVPVHRAAITETVKVILSYTVSMRLARETWLTVEFKKGRRKEGRKKLRRHRLGVGYVSRGTWNIEDLEC